MTTCIFHFFFLNQSIQEYLVHFVVLLFSGHLSKILICPPGLIRSCWFFLFCLIWPVLLHFAALLPTGLKRLQKCQRGPLTVARAIALHLLWSQLWVRWWLTITQPGIFCFEGLNLPAWPILELATFILNYRIKYRNSK